MAGDGVLIEQLLEEVKERLAKIEEQNGVIIGHLEALEAALDSFLPTPPPQPYEPQVKSEGG